MYQKIDYAYDTEEAAQRIADQLRSTSPISEAYILGPFKMDEELAMKMYRKRDIWTVSGEIYK